MMTMIEWNAASATPFAIKPTIFTKKRCTRSNLSIRLSTFRSKQRSRSIIRALNCGSRSKPKGTITPRRPKQITNAVMAERAVNMNRFSGRLTTSGLELRRGRPEILQVNVGKLCNLTCVHCHVNAGPKRKEIMNRETIDRVVEWLGHTDIPIVDLTGGAPEMIPDFR